MSLRSWFLERLFTQSRGDGLTCEERMLKLMKDGDWISTDSLHEHFRDYKDSKYELKKKGYIFERKYEGKIGGKQKKGTQYKTFYRLAGKIPCVPPSKGKRGYIEDFDQEELLSELWKRDLLRTVVHEKEISHLVNYDKNYRPRLRNCPTLQ